MDASRLLEQLPDAEVVHRTVDSLLKKAGLKVYLEPYSLPREAVTGMALVVVILVYVYLGKFLLDIGAYVIPVAATLDMLGEGHAQTAMEKNKRHMLYAYWLAFSAWNVFIDPWASSLSVFYPLVKFSVLMYLYTTPASTAHLMEVVDDAVPAAVWGRDLDYLVRCAVAAVSGEPMPVAIQEAEARKTSTSSFSSSSSSCRDKGASSDDGEDGGIALVTIKTVDCPQPLDGVLVVVRAQPGKGRDACAAEKLTFKTRVAVGDDKSRTTVSFNQTIRLGKLPDWSGFVVVEVRSKPTFGAQKILLSTELALSSFSVGEPDDSVDFAEMTDGVALTGCLALLSGAVEA